MPYLSTDSEHCELRFGANLVGGRGDGSVALAALAPMPPTALILVRGEGGTVMRRLFSRVDIRVDGEVLGSATVALLDGSHVEIGGCRLIYNNTADAITGRTPAPALRTTGERPAPMSDADLSAWLLRELRTGRTIAIPRAGMSIGRSEECRLVVAGRNVSRRHAVLEPAAAGFAISDQSSNGTLVNGTRCQQRQSLIRGDVVRIGDEDYRVEDGGAIEPPTSERDRPTEVMPTVPVAELRAAIARPEPLASLAVVRGRLRGKFFVVERPVCSIGTGESNGVRISDDSVDASHATLLLKAGTWYVNDLRSRNGTFVDGYRIAGERALAFGSTLSVGDVVMVFRARPSAPEPERPKPGGFFRRLGRLLEELGARG